MVVRLCSIKCCFSHPLATCDHPANQAFRNDIEGWAKVATRLWVWDYTTVFAHYLLPFPNQRVIGPNIRYFVAHHVKGIFEEDTVDTLPTANLAALGGYVMAKCLWNPNCDADRAINEFLAGILWPGGRPDPRLSRPAATATRSSTICTPSDTSLDSPLLTDDLLVHRPTPCGKQAEEQVAGQPDVLRRVKLSRMSLDYAILERARLAGAKEAAGHAAVPVAGRSAFQAVHRDA